jgi:outer membrane receptor protein involved in Fe transport
VQTALNSNVQTLPFVNQGNVKSKGIDFEFQYSYDNNLKFVFNTSKLDLTTKDVYGREKNIPNEPFLTANASVQYSFDGVGGKDGRMNLYYNFMYVDSFSYISPLYSNNAGTDFFDIPEQFVNDLGVSYTFPNRKFVVSFDAKNIFDKQAFDNFAVQKPGRAFYLKLNYIINNF